MSSPGTFTYDDKGNTLTHTIGGSTTSYTWDYLNRMSQWSQTGQTTLDFVYNADGMRVEVTPQGGTTMRYVLIKRDIVEEITGSDVVSYVGLGPICKISGSTYEVYHIDGMGSNRALSDNTQSVQSAEIYNAYGNIMQSYPTGSNPTFGYAAQYRYYTDPNGLHYLKARYYDPSVGRFISRDPIGFKGGFNLYAYVENCPVTRVDPSGLQGCRGGDTSCPDCKQEYNVCMADALNQFNECFQSVFGTGDLLPGGVISCLAGCAAASIWNGELTWPICALGCGIGLSIYTGISWAAARWACAGPYERAKDLCAWQCQNCRHKQ